MKKILKLIALTLSLLTIAFCFSGCKKLDQMRNSLVKINENGNLVYGDKEYILLPECEELSPYFDYMGDNYLYVTEEDVPLLLSPILGTEYILSADSKFITAADSYENELFFCRSDIHKEILERINSGFRADSYCYTYYDYETEKDLTYVLKENEREAIHTVLKTVKAEVLPDIADINYDCCVELFACSSDLIFQKYVYDLYTVQEKYYLTARSGDSNLIYTIPENLYGEFEKIMKPAIDSEYVFYDY